MVAGLRNQQLFAFRNLPIACNHRICVFRIPARIIAGMWFRGLERASGIISPWRDGGPHLRLRDLPGVEILESFNDPAMSDQSANIVLERNTSREPAHLTSSRAMVIQPILAEEISENPCCSGNREGLGVFAPIRMIVGIRKKQRYPHE
jgi:hypothetical protein